MPPQETARKVLEAGLNAWRQGRPPGEISTSRPKAMLVDSLRRPGQRLKRYEVLGEVSSFGHVRGYAVRLSLEDPEEQQVARYLVVGVDPLWVFRQEDYERLAHWEHVMDAPKAETDP